MNAICRTDPVLIHRARRTGPPVRHRGYGGPPPFAPASVGAAADMGNADTRRRLVHALDIARGGDADAEPGVKY